MVTNDKLKVKGFTMQQLKNLFSRQCYRFYPFWLLVLVIAYTLSGFVLAPYLIQKTIIEQVNQNLGWEAKVEKIEVNPYLLTLSIDQLSIVDLNKKEVIGFSRLYTDFTLRSVFELAATFEKIELVDPRIDLTVNKDGSTNLQQALDANALEVSPEETEMPTAENTEQSLFPVLFDNIMVKNGGLSVTNHQPKTAVFHQIKPITFNLQNFSTRLNEDGQYELNIALGTGQTLHWKGLLALNPIRSSGLINISGIKTHKFWPYVQELVPYQLESGIASVTGEYAVSMLKEDVELKIKQAVIDIDKIKFTSELLEDGFVDVGHINIGPTDFDLQAKSVSISQVTIDQFILNVLRDAQGELPMLAPLAQMPADTEEKTAVPTAVANETNEEVFKWSIGKVAMTNSQVNWSDKQPKQPVAISINNINVELNKLNQDLSTTLPFSVDYLIDASEKNEVQGDVVIQPFKLDSHLKLAGFDLTSVQPYISDVVKVKLEKGLLFSELDLALSENEAGEMLTNIAGGIQVKQFNSRDKLLNKRLVGWEDLTVNPMKVSLNPLSIDIEKIALSAPYVRMIIAEDGSTNLSHLVVEDKTAKQPTAVSNKADKKPEKAMPMRIGEITLNGGSAYFADLSLRPQFGSGIENMEGYIKGLSSDAKKPADVDIKGAIEDYGTMLIKGEVNPFSKDLYTDIDANFDKVELTTMTPYSGRYAGYVIDKGKLSLHLNYKINKRRLDGKNRLILDQFELGDSVESKDSLNLPIKLALALFKDKDGVIDINLPTAGDLDDPEFKITGLLLKSLGTLITKAATSPFSAIAGLAGGDAEQLNSVAFELGNSELNAQQKDNLKTLSGVLNNRPQLVLEVRVMVDQKAEADVLKAKYLEQALIASDIDMDDQEQLLEAKQDLYAERKSQQALDELAQKIQTEVSTEKQSSNTAWTEVQFNNVQAERYEAALSKALLATQPLASLELLTLARKRISVIKRELIKVNKVANAQVFALNPSLTGTAEKQVVISEFTLNAK